MDAPLGASRSKPQRGRKGLSRRGRCLRVSRWIAVSAGLLVFVILTSRKATAERFTCKSRRGLSPYAVQIAPTHDHDRHAPNEREEIKRFAAYVSSFDGRDDGDGEHDLLAVPEWVSYELKGLNPKANGTFEEPDISIRRPSNWYRAPGLAFLWTNRPAVRRSRVDNSHDGIGRVWNRGHLAMADHAQRISWQASCNTHFFWNAVPQGADMNQGPWRHLEDYIAAANHFGRLWIIAGPVFEANKAVGHIGEASMGEVPVAVPHGVFKVVVREVGDREVAALAFMFTQHYEQGTDGRPRPAETWVNCSAARGRGHINDHRSRLKSVAEIEALTGLRFFPDAANREDVVNEVPSALWPVASRYWDPGGCAQQSYIPQGEVYDRPVAMIEGNGSGHKK